MPHEYTNSDDQSTASVFWPSLIIWLTVFATFSVPGRTTAVTINTLDSVAVFKIIVRLFSIVVLSWIIFSRLRSQRPQIILTGYVAWTAFVFWAIVSTAWSPLRGVSLGQAAGQVSLLMLSVSIALAAPRGKRTFLINIIAALAVYCALYGLGSLALPELFRVARSENRSLVHPTHLGSAASLGFVLVVCLLLTARRKRIQGLLAATLPLFAVAMAVANNRMSILLALVLSLVIVFVHGQSFRLAAVSAATAIVGTLYVLLDPGLTVIEYGLGSSVDFLHRGQSVRQLSEFSGRTEMWGKMWASFLESPVIGHGYFVCSATGKLFVWSTERNHTAHNLALQALVSTGVIGFLLFFTWTLQVARIMLNTWRDRTADHHLQILAPAVFIWFVGWSILNESTLGPIQAESAVYAVVIGLAFGFYYASPTMTDRAPETSGWSQ